MLENMSSDRHRDVHLLSDLRAKFGHQIVDALIERMVIAPAPLTEALRHAVESMLSWQPESGPSMHSAAPQVQRASPEDLLSDLPSPLHDLAAAVASATTLVARQMDELETAFLALAEQSYVPFLAASRDDRSNSQWNPLRLRQTTAHKRATKAMESDSALARLCKAREFVTSFGHPKQWARLYDAVELLVYGAWRLCLLRGEIGRAHV